MALAKFHQASMPVEIIPSFGPARFRIPAHNQVSNIQTPVERAEPEIVSEEPVRNAKRMGIVGGWKDCEGEQITQVPEAFAVAVSQNKIKKQPAYTQNVKSCKMQLVNGLKFKVVMSFDEIECSMSYYKSFAPNTDPSSIFSKYTLYEENNAVEGIKACSAAFAA